MPPPSRDELLAIVSLRSVVGTVWAKSPPPPHPVPSQDADRSAQDQVVAALDVAR